MPYASESTNHITPRPAALGPTAKFGELFAAAQQKQFIVDSAFGMQDDILSRYRDQVESVERNAGIKLNPGWVNGYDAISSGMRRLNNEVEFNNIEAKYLLDIDNIDKAIDAARHLYPNAKTFKEIYDEEVIRRKEIIDNYLSVQARSGGGIGNWVEDFLGAASGSFHPTRDPVFFASMFIPVGTGRGLAMKLLGEAFIGGGAQAVQDIGFVHPRARMLGEPVPDLFGSIVTSALAGVAVRFGLEGIPPAYRAAVGVGQDLLAIRDPNAQRALAVSRMLDETEPNPFAPRMTERELLNALNLIPPSPQRAAAQATLINDIATAEIAPNGGTREGAAQADAKVTAALDIIEQARPMNPRSTLFQEGPTPETVMREIKENDPELAARLEEIDSRIKNAEDVVRESEKQLTEFNTGKAFDEEIAKIRTRFDQQMEELETIRREARTSPDNTKIALERARIEKQAKDEITQLGSVRFLTGRMLKNEVATAKRTIRDQRRRRDVLAGLAPAPKAQQAANREGLTPRTEPYVTDHIEAELAKPVETPDARTAKVDQIVAEAEASLKIPIEERRPVIKTPEEIEKMPLTNGKIADGWQTASKVPGLVDKIESLFAMKMTATQIARMHKDTLAPLQAKSLLNTPPTTIVRAVQTTLNIPSKDNAVEFDKWLTNYNMRNATRGDQVRAAARKALKEHGLLDELKRSIEEGTTKPTMQVMGRDIPVDLEIPGPQGSRPAIRVLDEIADEDNMLRAARECGLGAAGKGTPE